MVERHGRNARSAFRRSEARKRRTPRRPSLSTAKKCLTLCYCSVEALLRRGSGGIRGWFSAAALQVSPPNDRRKSGGHWEDIIKGSNNQSDRGCRQLLQNCNIISNLTCSSSQYCPPGLHRFSPTHPPCPSYCRFRAGTLTVGFSTAF